MSAPYRVGIVIPSGGRGVRLGAGTPKQYLEICGQPIIVRTLMTALSARHVEAVIIAAQPEEFEHVRTLLDRFDCMDERVVFVEGGIERQESVAKGLAHPALDSVEVILIHDAVRPLASTDLFDRVAEAAQMYGAVIPAVAVTDTLKRVDSDGVIVETIDRSSMRRAQTPQGFSRELIRRVYSAATTDGTVATDCASLCEHAGIAVHVIEGEERNIKVTTAFDLELASMLLCGRS